MLAGILATVPVPCQFAAHSYMPRSRLGPLAIESKLGDHPSQSSVWRAIHVQLKRAIAVKVFSSPFGGTPEARAEFASEWETLKNIDHPAIVRCFGGGFEASEAYLAYELIAGDTLAAQIERRSRLPWEFVLDFAEPIADALNHLHQRKIIHGAIQPDKILFSGFSPILIDVRVNRFSTPLATNRPPTAQEISLRAPELTRDPTRLTPQSDLYSLGATLYLAITGRAPIEGDTVEAVTANADTQIPESPASTVMDCPVWLDKLVMQLLDKDPDRRPHGAEAVTLVAEVRKRSMSRVSVAEHTSAGFSPLNVTDQKDRDEARILLGHGAVEFDDEVIPDGTPWHEKPLVLVSGLLLIVALMSYLFWPLNEDQMRAKAEVLLQGKTRGELHEAKQKYLQPMLEQFPDGQHATWAVEQMDRVEMLQAENALSVKMKRNLPLKNEGERQYAEAVEFERFGDIASALDRYRSIETLLGDDPQYRPFVNLARRQIAKIEGQGSEEGEAARIIQAKLAEAEKLQADGKVVSARKIWYSVVDLYGNNANVAPLVAKAQQRLAGERTTGNQTETQESGR